VDLSVVPGDALTWEQIRESNFDDKTAFPPGVIMDRELYKTEPIPCDDIPGGKK
jgi:hypothetical protein